MSDTTSSLSVYELQLSQVKLGLQADPDNQELLELRADLEQLIQLTQESLLEEKKKELLNQVMRIKLICLSFANLFNNL